MKTGRPAGPDAPFRFPGWGPGWGPAGGDQAAGLALGSGIAGGSPVVNSVEV